MISGLHLLYNICNRYVFCNKPFKTFLERQMLKDKPTLLLAMKLCNFYESELMNSHIFLHIVILFYTVFILYKCNCKS